VQVNGKVRARITISATATPAEIEASALEAVQASLGGATPKKVIVVPGRAVNIVA
jgi:leucyl-tRNA synthetase